MVRKRRYRLKHGKTQRVRVRCGGRGGDWLEFRCSQTEKQCYAAYAGSSGSMSEWIRKVLGKVVGLAANERDSPVLVDLVDAHAMESGLDRSQWIRRELLKELERSDYIPKDARRVQLHCVPRDG